MLGCVGYLSLILIFFLLIKASKLILDEYFASIEFLSSGEAGAEFGLSASTSTASIPLTHKLDSTSPLVDSGVDLNVMSQYSGMNNQSSVDVDDVFTDDTTGEKRDIYSLKTRHLNNFRGFMTYLMKNSPMLPLPQIYSTNPTK